MPKYVYACDSCSAQFEQFQRFSDEPLTTCPRCQGSVRRVFQPVGIVFKGSGWYVTDSRGKNTAATPAPSAGGESAPSTGGEGGESTPSSTGSTSGDSGTSTPSGVKSDSPPASSSS